jgi:hypothetical protein
MTLRLNDTDHARLREKARAEGISMQEAARCAIRQYLRASRQGEASDETPGR